MPISMEEMMGGKVTPATPAPAPSSKGGTIPISQMLAKPDHGVLTDMENTRKVEAEYGQSPTTRTPAGKVTRALVEHGPFGGAIKALESFAPNFTELLFDKAPEAVKAVVKTIPTERFQKTGMVKGGIDPKIATATAKAITNGLVSMAELADQGWSGMVGARSLTGTFESGMESAQRRDAHIREFANRITKVNLANVAKESEGHGGRGDRQRRWSEQEQAMNDLLMILPESAVAAGEDVYQKTGSAIAAAGVQALGNFLMFETGQKTLTKMFKGVPKDVVREAGAVDPEITEAVANHMEKENPKAAEEIRKTAAEGAAMGAEELKATAAKNRKRRGAVLKEEWDWTKEDTSLRLEGEEPAAPAKTPEEALAEFAGKESVNSESPGTSSPSPLEAQKAADAQKLRDALGEKEKPIPLRRDQIPEWELELRESNNRASTGAYRNRPVLGSDLPHASVAVPPELELLQHQASPIFKKYWEYMQAKGWDRNEKHVIDNDRPLVKMKDLLGSIAFNSKTSYGKLMARVAEHIGDDVGVHFVHPDHAILEGAFAHYSPSSNMIRIALSEENLGKPFLIMASLHEGAHAAVFNFMKNNPLHPYVKEMRSLMAEAKMRARRMHREFAKAQAKNTDRNLEVPLGTTPPSSVYKGKNPYNRLYGMRDPHEFVAESLSDPQFMRFLVNSEKYASLGWKGKTIVREFRNLVRKIIRVPEGAESTLLDQVLNLTENTLQVAELRRVMGEDRRSGGAVRTKEAPPSSLDVIRLQKQYDKFKKEVDRLFATPRGEVGSEAWHSRRDRIRELVDEAPKIADELDKSATSATDRAKDAWGDVTVYSSGGLPVTRADIQAMTQWGLQKARKSKAFVAAEGRLRAWSQELAEVMLPEATGRKAVLAADAVAKTIAKWKAAAAQLVGKSLDRRKFWNNFHEQALDFIDKYERGIPFEGPNADLFNRFREFYTSLMGEVAQRDKQLGIKYDEYDNYVTHLFKDGKAAANYLKSKYGRKFGDPYFMKDRIAKTFKELVDMGHEPLYTNPEDIMMARVKASNIAQAKIEMLDELVQLGLAVRADVKGGKLGKAPHGWAEKAWRSPNGKKYFVHPQTELILHNAFETKSLWNDPGVKGDLFRGGMWVKNKIVPIRLFGLFHAMHIGLLINNAAAFARIGKQLLAGHIDHKTFVRDLAEGVVPFSGAWNKSANRVLKAYWGEISPDKLTQGERDLMGYMQEGGLVPGMAEQDIGSSRAAFKDAVQKGKMGSAVVKFPFAVIDSLQYPMFHIWIPTLKIAAYAKDIALAMELRPELVTDAKARMQAFAKIRRSVDNRFGEMNYDTLFWHRTFKDMAVLSTLSVGWQLGFLREYGGGIMDAGRAVFDPKDLKSIAKSGELDRTMFAASYVAGAAVLTGVLSYYLSGQPPEGLDYFYPRSGELDENGKPKRLNTPFFNREFASIYKHMQNEGVVEGLSHLVTNKASGVYGTVSQIVTGVDGLGREIRDPNGPAYQKIAQTVSALYDDVSPISVEGYKSSEGSQQKALSLGGFSPAPKYATETQLEGKIAAEFQAYRGQKKVPFRQQQFSADKKELRKLYDKNDPGYENKLDEVIQKYNLTNTEVHKLEASLKNPKNRYVSMFKQLPWESQKRLLDAHWKDMTEEDREMYVNASNKEHLRYNYEGPEK